METKYYSTNDIVSKLTDEFGDNIQDSKLFYYEEKGLIKVARADNDYRQYSEENYQELRLIISFLAVNVSIELIKKFMDRSLSMVEFVEINSKVTQTKAMVPTVREALKAYRFEEVRDEGTQETNN